MHLMRCLFTCDGTPQSVCARDSCGRCSECGSLCFNLSASGARGRETPDSKQDPKAISVRIKQSKTDPFRQGVSIYLGNSPLCPVAALLSYLVVWHCGEGPLLQLKDGQPLNRPQLVSLLRKALATAGFDQEKYAGQSLGSVRRKQHRHVVCPLTSSKRWAGGKVKHTSCMSDCPSLHCLRSVAHRRVHRYSHQCTATWPHRFI